MDLPWKKLRPTFYGQNKKQINKQQTDGMITLQFAKQIVNIYQALFHIADKEKEM